MPMPNSSTATVDSCAFCAPASAPGGQFVLHARTLPGNPYDGHTLGAVIEATERLTGREIERAYVDKGYRGHDAANPRAQSRACHQAARRALFHHQRTCAALK